MKGNIVLSSLALLVSIASIGYVFNMNSAPSLAYVDNIRLYNSFSLKKELESKLDYLKNERKTVLDSLELEIDRLALNLDKQESPEAELVTRYKGLVDVYRSKSDAFANENEERSQEFNQQVWTQLNQYVQEFGDEHQYQFVFGTSGTGNIMYANKGQDVTEDLIKYANEKYAGR